MVNRDIDTILWLVLLVSAFFFGPDVCLAGRVELLHDAGPRQVMAYWEAYANPFQTQGLAVQFEPSGFPCFVREVSVFVNSTAEFRIHIVDFDQVELCEVATIGAVKPRSWATYVLPYQVEVDCDGFWVIAEITKPPEPGIGTTYEPNGGTTVYTKNWDSENGIHYTGWGGNGGNAMIRTVVDVPVQVESISNLKAGNDHLFVTFDSPMDASTLNAETITLDAEPSGRILGTYEYDDSLTRVEFTPDSSLQPGFLSLEVSTGVVDIYGNRPSSPTHRLFVVGNETDQTPPARPGDVSVQTEDAIVVRWNAVPLADAAGYYLYSGPWQPGTTEEQWLANASKTDVGDVTETPVLVAQMESHYRVGVAAYDTPR
ncbi:MAG TPA: Ig-like domain-containing protein, partial [bacterium]|nr:Ig-like domain-containing protein [bacterium]